MNEQELAMALVQQGILSEAQVQSALSNKGPGQSLAEVLLAWGWVSPQQINMLMSPPAPGMPAYGAAPTYNPPANNAPYPPQDPNAAQNPYGTPNYGAPAYGATNYGAPAYGATNYGAPGYGAPYGAYSKPVGPSFSGPQPRTIDIGLIGEAWNLLQQQMGVWVGAGFIYLILIGMAQQVMGLVTQPFTSRFMPTMTPGTVPNNPSDIIQMFVPYFGAMVWTTTLTSLVLVPLQAFLAGGMFKMALGHVRRRPPNISDLFSCGPLFLPLTLTMFLVNLASVFGVLACFIGTYVIGGLAMFAMPLVIDRKMQPLDAISLSFKTLSPNWLMAGCFFFVAYLVAGLGILLCCVGVILTTALAPLSIALLYDRYFPQENPGEAPSDANFPPPPIPTPF